MIEDKRTVSEADLARLKSEREDADRRYNDALTALDAAIRGLPDVPHPPPPPDETQVTPLNQRWDILTSRPAFPDGLRGRLARFVWGLVEPLLASQQAFNAALVDHVNRNIAPQRGIPNAIGSTIALLQQQVEQLGHFQSRLIVYLQQVTSYVDTKDYEFAGLGRRITEDAQEQLDRLDRMVRGLAAGLSGVSDEIRRRWESLQAHDQRQAGRFDDMRSTIVVAQQQLIALKREFDRMPELAGLKSGPPPETGGRGASPTEKPGFGPATSQTDSWKYVGFENLFRGSPDLIRSRLEDYAPLFDGASEILDVGCGRGEFLDILRSRGIAARGIDLNHEMVEQCRARGLDVLETDALVFLRMQPDESLGGLIATQVVEHLEPSYLLEFLDHAQRALRPGSAMVLETINAACWLAFFESYLRDITHARALHPDTLKYLVTASGFVVTEVQFKAPVDPDTPLQPAPRAAKGSGDALDALVETFDRNVDRLNRRLFTYLDFAVVARRP